MHQDGSFILVGVEGEISVGLPGSPSINSVLALQVGTDGLVEAEKVGNEFPAYEIYQDRNGDRGPVREFDARTHGYLINGPAGHVFRAFATRDYWPSWLGGS